MEKHKVKPDSKAFHLVSGHVKCRANEPFRMFTTSSVHNSCRSYWRWTQSVELRPSRRCRTRTFWRSLCPLLSESHKHTSVGCGAHLADHRDTCLSLTSLCPFLFFFLLQCVCGLSDSISQEGVSDRGGAWGQGRQSKKGMCHTPF